MRTLQLRLVLTALLILALNACREEIIHNLDEPQANALLSKLSQASIPADKIAEPSGAWAIAVDSDRMLEALRILEQSKLLRAEQDDPDTGSSGILSSREQQRLRYERALSHEVEKTLSSLDGVRRARVHLNLPQVDPIFGQALVKDDKGSASVLVVSDAELTHTPQDISQLVSGAAGIPAEQVRVLFDRQIEIKPAPFHAAPGKSWNSIPRSIMLALAVLFGLCGMGALSWYLASSRRTG